MNNEQILKQAIAIAVENGYKFPFESTQIYNDGKLIAIEDGVSVEGMIFSHDFAKAFWGSISEIHCTYSQDGMGGSGEPLTDWSYHLQQMVLKEDPVKYLEPFLKITKKK